jgi:anti-sigma B factor antagonist
MDLSVSTRSDDGVTTVAIAGELDLSSGDVVARSISRAVRTEGTRAVTVDLAELRFIDSSGISVLLKGRREADEAGLAYRVTGATGIVRQVLGLSGVLEHLSDEPR